MSYNYEDLSISGKCSTNNTKCAYIKICLNAVLIYKFTISEAKDLLRQWREGNERRSDEVMDLWTDVVEQNVDKLGNESK